MKKIILTLSAVFAVSLSVSASLPDELTEEYGQTEFSVSDPEYEWSQMDTKKAKVFFKSQALVLDSKDANGSACTVSELPIDVEEMPEFIFGFNLITKVGNNSNFGMVFDYNDARNYKGISIDKKQYTYFTVKDGVYAVVKSGPVKYKGTNFTLLLKRESGGIEFVLNGIEVCKLRKIELTSSLFGAFVSGKAVAVMPSFIMYMPEQKDTEQSTSNT